MGGSLEQHTPSFLASCCLELSLLPAFPEHPLSFIFCNLGHSRPQGFWAWAELSWEKCRRQEPLNPKQKVTYVAGDEPGS